MLIVHAVQKLLTASGIEAKSYISEPSPDQMMHAWYARLVATGFVGRQLVMYVHQPSLLLVLTRGKSLNTTLPVFHKRLADLLERQHFKPLFIEREIELIKEGYVVGKTSSRSMLASMNAIIENIEAVCRRQSSYGAINLDGIEDTYLDWLTYDSRLRKYLVTKDYWIERGVLDKI
ncbi:MAG: hypothetical protein ABIR81_12505 [Ginsengibacter sp.]